MYHSTPFFLNPSTPIYINIISMKRERGISMGNYLMFLSGTNNYLNSCSNNNRVFECKTCNRQFQSFQALGGHRASHKKQRLMGSDQVVDNDDHGSAPKPKTHECSICGLEFAIGQALGGHMRRHRAASTNSLIFSSSTANNNNKRLLFPDLNLTPLENDLEFLKIRQPTPLVHC